MAGERTAIVERSTRETHVRVELNLDGKGEAQVNTGFPMLDHLLDQLARHGVFDLTVTTSGDLLSDGHHTVEDVAIALGQAFLKALGDKRGIRRMAHAVVPMDEVLALVAVDFSGRGYAVVDAGFGQEAVAGLSADLFRHFLETFAAEARMNLHAKVLAGTNDHHKAEAIFKALAKALDWATQLDPRIEGQVPSTKEFLEG